MYVYGNDELNNFLEKLVELPEMGEYGYDWERFASFYDPESRMFYWVEGSGCSCNDLWDDVYSIADLNVGRKDEFLKAAASFGDSGYSDYGQGRYAENFETLRRAVKDLS